VANRRYSARADFPSLAPGYLTVLMYSNTIRGRHFPVTGCENSQLFLSPAFLANLLVSEHPSRPPLGGLLSIRFFEIPI